MGARRRTASGSACSGREGAEVAKRDYPFQREVVDRHVRAVGGRVLAEFVEVGSNGSPWPAKRVGAMVSGPGAPIARV